MNRVFACGYSWLNFFVEKPSRGLLLICVLQIFGWGILVTFFMPIPYFDIMFHSFVGRSHDFWGGFFHHPPLAFVLAHWLNFGEVLLVYPHNIAAQLVVIATYMGVYYMGLALFRDKVQALVSVLLLIPLGVYQGAPITDFNYGYLQGLNHNVLQYPFWIFIPLVTFYATRPLSDKARQSLWWLVLGVLSGMGLWTKISIGILYGTVLAWTLIDRSARQHYKTAHPYFAIFLCLLIGANPLFYGTLNWQHMAQYVVDKARDDGASFDRISEVLVIVASMVSVAIVARGISLRTRLTYPFARLTPRNSHFLLFVTFVPFFVILVGSVYRQILPLFSWTLPMYALWGIVLVAIMRATWRAHTPHVILLAAIVLLLKPVYYYPLAHGFYPKRDNHWVISEKIMHEWNTQTHNAPLGVVYGNNGDLAAAVSLYGGGDLPLYHLAENKLYRGAFFVFHDHDLKKNSVRAIIERLQIPEQRMKIDEYPHMIYYAILPPER